MIAVADATVSMSAVLEMHGFHLRGLPCQIPCPVHKRGQEQKPSARLYADDRTVWCYTCLRQYGVTDVHAAQRGIKKAEAARDLLDKWPTTPEKIREISKLVTLPKKKTLAENVRAILEDALIQRRGKVPFERYRELAKRTDQICEALPNLPEDEQVPAVQAFLSFVRQETWG